MWVFLPKSINVIVRLTDYKWAVVVDVKVCGCFPLCVSPLIDRHPVQSVPCILSNDSWEKLDKQFRKYMDCGVCVCVPFSSVLYFISMTFFFFSTS